MASIYKAANVGITNPLADIISKLRSIEIRIQPYIGIVDKKIFM